MSNKYAQFSKAPKRPRYSPPSRIIRFRKCSMKQGYGTKTEADKAAAARQGFRSYRCNFCKTFHLTSQPLRQQS